MMSGKGVAAVFADDCVGLYGLGAGAALLELAFLDQLSVEGFLVGRRGDRQDQAD